MSRRRSPDERLLHRAALRVGVQTAAAMAVAVVALSAVAVLVVLRDQHHSDDQLVDMAIARADDVVDPPAGVWLAVRSAAGAQVTSPGLPTGLPDAGELARTAADHAPRSTERWLDGREYRVDTRPYGRDGAIQAALDLAANHAERFHLMRALLITGAAGLLLVAALSVWLARRAVTPLAQALALQRRFVADAGHELRTPLTLLSTRTQLVQRSLDQGAEPDTLRSDVDGLVRDTRALGAILDDLLISVDPRALATGPVELTGLVRDAVNAARPAAEDAGIHLNLSVSDGPVIVPASAAGLRRAVTALLDNAIRHATGVVRVGVGARRDSVTVEVSDDGPGIAPELLPTLFDRFARAATDNPNGPRRYGLGLALVSEIAARHGGTVEAGSADDGGARFRLTLPAGPRSRQEFSQKPPAR